MGSHLSSKTEHITWAALGALLVAVLLYAVHIFIGAFIIGIFAYYASRPLYRQLKQYIPWPTLAALSALTLFFAPLFFFLVYGLLIGVRELQLIAARYDDSVLRTLLDRFFEAKIPAYSVQELGTLVAEGNVQVLTRIFRSIVESADILSSVVITLFLAAIVSFYLLRDGHRLRSWTLNLFPHKDVVTTYFSDVDRDLHYIFFGNLLNAAVAATFAVIVYQGLNIVSQPPFVVPYPFVLGIATGLASLIPVVGMKIVYVPIAVYFYGRGIMAEPNLLVIPTVFTVVVVVLVDGVPDLFLRPYITSRDLHMGMLLAAYVIGPILFGWYGLFLGPMIIVATGHFTKTILPFLLRDSPPAHTATLDAYTEQEDDESGTGGLPFLPGQDLTPGSQYASQMVEQGREATSRVRHAVRESQSGSGDGESAGADDESGK